MTKEEVITYLKNLKDEYHLKIYEIIYDDIKHSLTFKELQTIDHLRTNIDTIYKIIEFIEKEGN